MISIVIGKKTSKPLWEMVEENRYVKSMKNPQIFWETGRKKPKNLGDWWKKLPGQCLGGKTENWMKIEKLKNQIIRRNKAGRDHMTVGILRPDF